ncbi:MAG TPA: hypothetical protein VIL72_01055 [Beijerinckiaceae bacterium]|jgi:hypothetical protein
MRLFFHMRERGRFSEDEEGGDFDTVEDAHREAIAAAREMMAERIRSGRPIDDVAFEIVDEEGERVLTVPWSDAIVRE